MPKKEKGLMDDPFNNAGDLNTNRDPGNYHETPHHDPPDHEPPDHEGPGHSGAGGGGVRG